MSQQLMPLGKNIIFSFAEETAGHNRKFVDSNRGRIVLTHLNFKDQGTVARWGKVQAIGPNVDSEIKVGEYVLVEPLAHTERFKFDGIDMWKTDESRVLCTSAEPVYQYAGSPL
jgi:hypothetical protein